MPHISSAYLINARLIKRISGAINAETREAKDIPTFLSFKKDDLDADMAFGHYLRDAGQFMFVDNQQDYGHLVSTENFNILLETKVHPDLHSYFEAPLEWRRRFVHPNWTLAVDPSLPVEQPCPDVHWFPLVTEKFTTALVETMEHFGRWSDGSNNDERLNGGYEAVPTRDIHMNQVGLEQIWLQFLRDYVRPVQEKIYTGYYHDPPKSIMNFVVRYRPDEQPLLRPHHDSSTYTINIALNRPGIDYEGGGCRFLRYNCSVTGMRIGWSLIHPGRLTHYHEGLRVTNGTRYIMISFVDP